MKHSSRSLYFLLTAFLVSGILHVSLYGVPLTDSIVQIFCGVIMIYFALTIQKRIIDKKLRNLLTVIAVLQILLFALQFCKYKLVASNVYILRSLWYLYYVAWVLIVLILFFTAICLNKQSTEKTIRRRKLLFIPAALLILLFITNDLHGLAFSLKDPLTSTGASGSYSYGIIYYIYLAWLLILLLLSIIIILRKCTLSVVKKKIWIPVTILLAGAALLICSTAFAAPRINGVTIWNSVEVYCFTDIIFIESCIFIGLIPSNTGYNRIFRLIPVSTVISDTANETIISSNGELYEDANTAVSSMPIYGGSVSWATDITDLNNLNKKIEETTNRINLRNEYLSNKNASKEEQVKIDARSRLFDRVNMITTPELNLVTELLNEPDDDDFNRRLAKVTVLTAYIKRRSNMELLKEDSPFIPVAELSAALKESADYLRLCGTDVMVSGAFEGDLPSDMIILAYEFFHYVVMSAHIELFELAIIVYLTEDVFSLRLMLQAEDIEIEGNWKAKELSKYNGNIMLSKQDKEVIVRLTLDRKGGRL